MCLSVAPVFLTTHFGEKECKMKRRNVAQLAIRLSLVPLLASAMAAAAQPAGQPSRNRQTDDAIFTEARGAGIPQIVAGLGDVVLAVAAYKLKQPAPDTTGITQAAKTISQGEDKVLAAASNTTLSNEEKLVAIHEAEAEVGNAKVAAVNALESYGFTPKVVRFIRVVGPTVFITDLAGRVWAWHWLHANPTWSPVATTVGKVGDGLSTQNALPAR
jgi:hypothetical protein